MRVALFWAFLWMTVPVWSQQSPPGAPQPATEQLGSKPAELCQLEGRVVDAQTGEPVKNARLILRDVGGRDTPSDTSTNAAGAFAMKDLAPGSYRLSAEKNGYVRQEYGTRGATRAGIVLALSPGQRLKDIVFQLVPHGVIYGRVLDADNEPVANVRLLALRSGYSRGKRRLAPAGNATTNDLGEYRLFGLPAGRYWISATYNPVSDFSTAVDRTAGESGFKEGYAPTFYPGTNDPGGAAPVEVGPGSKVSGINFTLLKTRTVRIRGRVVNFAGTEGATAGGLIINLIPREGGSLGTRSATVRDAKGSFEIRGVSPGSYTLIATFFAGSKRYAARQPIEVSIENLDNVSLEISAGRDLAGIVKVEGEGPANLGGVAVYIDSRDVDSPFGGILGRVGQDRTFVLPNVTAGEYTVEVMGLSEEFYLKSLRIGREDVLESGLMVNSAAAGEALELTLSSGGGAIDGVVQNEDQQPTPGVRVVLVPDERRRNQIHLYKSASTDQYGHFALKAIAPGDYKLFAWEDVEAETAQDPDFLKDFEKLGEAIVVREKERSTKQLKLIPTGSPGTQRQKAAVVGNRPARAPASSSSD